MKFTITLEIDREAAHKASLIQELSTDINRFLDKKYYGRDILKYLLGCICVKTKVGYEDWFKIRKPKYTDYKKAINKLTGLEMEIIKTFENDFKLDNDIYEEFVALSDEVSYKILAREILNSLTNLDSLPKKVKDFNKEAFKNDMKFYFEERGLI